MVAGKPGNHRNFNYRFHGSFPRREHDDRFPRLGEVTMDVSKIAPPPIAVVVPNYDSAKPNDQSKRQDSGPTWEPPKPSPLPPGQGTRIDQIA